MFEQRASVLLSLSQDMLDRARVMAGKATTALKLPVSLQIVLRALVGEGLKRDNHPALLANIEGQAKAVRDQRSATRRRPRSLLVATVVVTTLTAAAATVYAETPTQADFAACNADAPAAMMAGTATPTTKDHMRVEAARTGGASSDPQLVGMAAEGITDASYQAAYRTCMRRSGF